MTFTKESDRLRALLGIVRIAENKTGLRCVDGHWHKGSWPFLRELMWMCKEQRTLSVSEDRRRSRLCSSWSWASLEGPITYPDNFASWKLDPSEDCDLYLHAIEDEVLIPWPSHPLKVLGMLRDEYIYQRVHKGRTFMVKAESSGVPMGGFPSTVGMKSQIDFTFVLSIILLLKLHVLL